MRIGANAVAITQMCFRVSLASLFLAAFLEFAERLFTCQFVQLFFLIRSLR